MKLILNHNERRHRHQQKLESWKITLHLISQRTSEQPLKVSNTRHNVSFPLCGHNVAHDYRSILLDLEVKQYEIVF